MVNLINITVCYVHRTHVFHFELNEILVDDILRSIGNYFHIDMNNFFLVIYDDCSELDIVFDDSYLNILRSDPYFIVNNSFTGQLRSLDPSKSNAQHVTIPPSLTSIDEIEHQPEHTLLWLDEHIDHPFDYCQLKDYFISTTAIDETSLISVKVDDTDINNLIRFNDATNFTDYYWNDTTRNFYTFSSVVDCLHCIEKESKSYRNIFLICSITFGKEIIPKIYYNNFIHSIYILTIDIVYHIEWAVDYIGKTLMFDHHLDLLSRLARDIARYYEKKSFDTNMKNVQHKLTYLYWTYRLLSKANAVDKSTTPTKDLLRIKKHISELEDCSNTDHMWKDKDKFSIDCEET